MLYSPSRKEGGAFFSLGCVGQSRWMLEPLFDSGTPFFVVSRVAFYHEQLIDPNSAHTSNLKTTFLGRVVLTAGSTTISGTYILSSEIIFTLDTY